MATKRSGVKVRYAMIQWFILDTLAKAERPLRIREVLASMDGRVSFTEHELEVVGRNKHVRWKIVVGFQFSPLGAAKLVEKSAAGFTITDAGREILNRFPDPYAEATDQLAGIAWTAYQERRKLAHYENDNYAVVSGVLDLLADDQWVSLADLTELSTLDAKALLAFLTDTKPEQRIQVLDSLGRALSVRNPELEWAAGQRLTLEDRGIVFTAEGSADLQSRLYAEEVRGPLEESGVLEVPPRRAWLVRGSSIDGLDITGTWRDKGFVSLAATKLRASVVEGVDRDTLKVIVDDDYAHASYAKRRSKLDDYYTFLSRMRIDDVVATTSKGRLFLGVVTGSAHFIDSEGGRSNLRRDVGWSESDGIDFGELSPEMSSRLQVQHDVVELSQQLEELEQILDAQREVAPLPEVRRLTLPDPDQDLADNLHVPLDWLQECVDLLRERPQLIFYGPPGTGKTYLARKLASHLAGDNVRLVQFHPAYSYEDFFEGYRPVPSGGFELRPGPLRQIVEQARDNPTAPYVLVIDEINRGNLAKIFGELYFLLEYRDESVDLLYAEETDASGFSLPRNVHIIGTMNTADRSIALVDSAMRRRFAFLSLHPDELPTSGILRSWLAAKDLAPLRADLLDELNSRIADADFKVGPSYLMPREEPSGDFTVWLQRVWRTSILPLLVEHHYGDTIDVAKRYGLQTLLEAVTKKSVTGAEKTDDASSSADPV